MPTKNINHSTSTINPQKARMAYDKAADLGIFAVLFVNTRSEYAHFAATCTPAQWRELLDSAKLIAEGRK